MLILRSSHRYRSVDALINPLRVNEWASHLERTRIADLPAYSDMPGYDKLGTKTYLWANLVLRTCLLL